MKSIDKLTDQQCLELAAYIRESGKRWREKIVEAFSEAKAYDLPRAVQAIVNKHGAGILPNLSTTDVLRDGDKVAFEHAHADENYKKAMRRIRAYTVSVNPIVAALCDVSEVL